MEGFPDSTATMAQSQRTGAVDQPTPGLLLVFCAGAPRCDVFVAEPSGIVIGRSPGILDDAHVSREHARVEVSHKRLSVVDAGSRNGTYLNGELVTGVRTAAPGDVLRVGETVFLVCDDVRPYAAARVVVTADMVIGPRMRETLVKVDQAASAGNRLLITGETGTGKELVARAYHRRIGEGGPFEALNCATLPATLAESLLFGSVRGAFSGATSDRPGHVVQADGGVLFLDEVAELEPQVQAKLLRVLETGEVLPLGSSKARKVDVRVCAATHQDLLRKVEDGSFRSDLYYRLAQSNVGIPPLRDRREEIPWLLASELDRLGPGLLAHGLLVESCLLRSWNGNIREFVAAIRDAAAGARVEHSSTVLRKHLQTREERQPAEALPGRTSSSSEISREELNAELLRRDGNLTQTARALGLHRTQLYRLLKRFGMRSEDAPELGAAGAPADVPPINGLTR